MGYCSPSPGKSGRQSNAHPAEGESRKFDFQPDGDDFTIALEKQENEMPANRWKNLLPE